jgi:hypothetical protein
MVRDRKTLEFESKAESSGGNAHYPYGESTPQFGFLAGSENIASGCVHAAVGSIAGVKGRDGGGIGIDA